MYHDWGWNSAILVDMVVVVVRIVGVGGQELTWDHVRRQLGRSGPGYLGLVAVVGKGRVVVAGSRHKSPRVFEIAIVSGDCVVDMGSRLNS